MKIVRVNVVLEFETNRVRESYIHDYLENLNDFLSDCPGSPQVVDIDEISEGSIVVKDLADSLEIGYDEEELEESLFSKYHDVDSYDDEDDDF